MARACSSLPSASSTKPSGCSCTRCRSRRDDARIFRIAAPDYLDTRFLSNVVAQVRREPPKCRVVIMNISRDMDHIRLLPDGGLDLVIANRDEPPPHRHLAKLFQGPSPAACAPTARMRAAPRRIR